MKLERFLRPWTVAVACVFMVGSAAVSQEPPVNLSREEVVAALRSEWDGSWGIQDRCEKKLYAAGVDGQRLLASILVKHSADLATESPESDEHVTCSALRMLAGFTGDTSIAKEAVWNSIRQDGRTKALITAIGAMSRLGGPQDADELVAFLGHSDPGIAATALAALRLIGDEATAEKAENCLSDMESGPEGIGHKRLTAFHGKRGIQEAVAMMRSRPTSARTAPGETPAEAIPGTRSDLPQAKITKGSPAASSRSSAWIGPVVAAGAVVIIGAAGAWLLLRRRAA